WPGSTLRTSICCTSSVTTRRLCDRSRAFALSHLPPGLPAQHSLTCRASTSPPCRPSLPSTQSPSAWSSTSCHSVQGWYHYRERRVADRPRRIGDAVASRVLGAHPPFPDLGSPDTCLASALSPASNDGGHSGVPTPPARLLRTERDRAAGVKQRGRIHGVTFRHRHRRDIHRLHLSGRRNRRADPAE